MVVLTVKLVLTIQKEKNVKMTPNYNTMEEDPYKFPGTITTEIFQNI